MRQRGELKPISGFRHLYEVTVPYARLGHVEGEEVLLEANPYAALSHATALVLHRLTDELPKNMTAIAPSVGTGDQLPLGTDPRDWAGIPLPGGRTPSRVLGRPVDWSRPKPERYFGVGVYQPRGYPIRATTPERTLLDGLLAPELTGGIGNVLRAWVLARDTLDLDKLVSYVDRFAVAVLRQRAGYVLDELGLSHPRLEQWMERTRRGGSSRLVGSAPYAPIYSERWNLSLNAPVTALAESSS
jgi:predicted transcriptional regulator of viral defense system